MEQLIQDYRQAEMTSADRAMLDYAIQLTLAPWTLLEDDVMILREHGFSDSAILDINQVTAYYAYVNRLASGLGVELEAELTLNALNSTDGDDTDVRRNG